MADTLVTALLRAAERDLPTAGIRFVALDERESWFGWADLSTRAARSAGTLRDAGLRPGMRIAMAIPTSIEFLDAFLGALWLGATPVPIYPPVRIGRLDEYIERTSIMLTAVDTAAVVTDRRTRSVFGQVLARVGCPLVAAEQLASGPERPAHHSRPDDLGLIQFSSGTTRAPKPVGLEHRALLANTDAILDLMPPTDDPPPAGVSWLPLYHDMGLIGCIFPALRRPGPLTLIAPEHFLARPALWLRAISRHRGTVSPAPDFGYAYATERISEDDLDGVDLSCWRLALNGAETVRAQTLDRFHERFGRLGLRREALTPVYGLSEAALAVTFTPPNEPPKVICADREALSNGELSLADDGMPLVSVGKPLDGYSIEIRGPEGDPCPPDTVGTLHVRGPSLLRGYIGIEEQPVEDGWLHTGDRALLHEHYLYIVGRQRDIIVMRGRNHDPAEIESAVGEVPGIRTGCVVAVGSMDDEGEHLWVFAEVREQRKQLAEECLQSIRTRCALTADLVALVEPGALPRTSSGKLRRQEALTRFRDGTLMPPARVGPLFMAGAWARSALGYLGAEL